MAKSRHDYTGLPGPTPARNAAGGYKVTGLGAAQRHRWPFCGYMGGTFSPSMNPKHWHEMIHIIRYGSKLMPRTEGDWIASVA